MEEFDTQPRISVKKGLDEKTKAKLEKGLEKNKKDIKEHIELLSEAKDEEKIQTHKTRLQELLDTRKKAEKLFEQEDKKKTIKKISERIVEKLFREGILNEKQIEEGKVKDLFMSLIGPVVKRIFGE